MSNLAKYTALLEKQADDEDFDANDRNEQKKFRKQYPVSDLDANLAMARMAVNFVRKKIPVTANDDLNLASGYEHQYFQKGVDDPSKVNDADKCVYGTLRQQQEYRRRLQRSWRAPCPWQAPKQARRNGCREFAGIRVHPEWSHLRHRAHAAR